MAKRLYIIIGVIVFSADILYAVTISGLTFTKATYEVYEKAEATFTLGTSYSNPYDSTIVQVDAEITPPSGPVFFVACFYYVPCNYAYASPPNFWNGTENVGGAKWMLRYCPTQTGNYQVRIRVLDGTTSYSSSVSFNSVASTRKGFVRIDPTNNQFMRFDNGTPYYPVGYNNCWNDGGLVDYYNTWLNTNMGPNNVNWSRYWFTDFARQALEWSSGHWSGWYNGLGRYSQRSAGMLDSVLNNCERKDIYLQLVLQHHGQLSTTVNPEWSGNPYNSSNGGPIATPAAFFTNASAKGQTKKLYRYIVARWGYSTNVLSWELFNEVEYTEGTDPNMDVWHDEMSTYLKSQDPNKHIVNTSTGGDNSMIPLLDDNISIDQIQWHTYAGGIEKVLYSQAETYKTTYNKPIICGEFGTAGSYTGHPDSWGDHVRKSMWIGMMNEAPNMFWYWDEYVQNKSLYSIFKPLADYLANEDIVTSTGGVAKKIKISVNPTLTGNAVVTPTQTNWAGTNSPNPFTSVIDGSGNASNVNGLHNYIQGTFQGTRNRDLSFNVTFQTAGSVTLNVTSVAGGATKIIEVRVDGALVTTWNPSGAGAYTYSGITAGNHTVRFYSTGQDWVEFSNITFSGVSLKALDAWGYTGTTKAYGYVNNLTYGDWSDPSSVPNITTAELRVGSLTVGSYDVEYWNPRTGTITSGGTLTTITDSLTLSLPAFNKDIAYKITPISLPIELLDFNGQINENGFAELYWTTLSEKNNAYFEIQRSDDGLIFYSVGKIIGNKNSSEAITYRYIDETNISNKVYYRLKQVDNDNHSTLSNIICLTDKKHTIVVYPNPANTTINIRITSTQYDIVETEWISPIGKIVKHETFIVPYGNSEYSIDIRDITSGIYFLQATFSSGLKEVFQVIKY